MSKIAESYARLIEREDLQPQTKRWPLVNNGLSLLPIMGIAYMFQYLDKAAIGASTLLGLLDPKTGIVSLLIQTHIHTRRRLTGQSMTSP